MGQVFNTQPSGGGGGATGVTAAAVIAANAVVIGDDGARGVKGSIVAIDNSGNVTGVVGLAASGAVTAGTIAVGGATIGTDVLAWTGTATGSGRLSAGGITNTGNGAASVASLLLNGTLFTGGGGTATFPQIFVQPTGTTAATTFSTGGTIFGANAVSGFGGNFLDFHVAGGASVFSVSSGGSFGFAGNMSPAAGSVIQWSGRGTLTSPAAGSLQTGGVDTDTNASIVAQTARSQGALAGGTADQAGKNWTFIASPGKGTGAGGQFIFQTTPAGSTGTTVNAVATGLTITAPAINMQPSVVVGNQAIATNATDGFLYVATCAGTPTGTPTTFTGRVALVYDTTNDQFWIYNAAWKQPKTPAGAAVVNWQ